MNSTHEGKSWTPLEINGVTSVRSNLAIHLSDTPSVIL